LPRTTIRPKSNSTPHVPLTAVPLRIYVARLNQESLCGEKEITVAQLGQEMVSISVSQAPDPLTTKGWGK